jgi:hypothetical protein
MGQVNTQLPTLREILQLFQEHKRLIAVVTTMTQEIERLDEDNAQLRAAVGVYREVVGRLSAPADQRIPNRVKSTGEGPPEETAPESRTGRSVRAELREHGSKSQRASGRFRSRSNGSGVTA